MTIEQYANKNGKKIEIVLKWIYDGLIPQASVDNDFVPDSARVPYRSNAKTLIRSMKALSRRALMQNMCVLRHTDYVIKSFKDI